MAQSDTLQAVTRQLASRVSPGVRKQMAPFLEMDVAPGAAPEVKEQSNIVEMDLAPGAAQEIGGNVVELDLKPGSAQRLYTAQDVLSASPEELASDKEFNPIPFGNQNQDALLANPALLEKVVNAYKAKEQRGTTLGEKVVSGVKAVPGVLGSIFKGAVEAGKVGFKQSAPGIGVALSQGENPLTQVTEAQAETGAALETAGLGTADLLRRSARKVFGSQPTTDQGWRERFFSDLAHASNTEQAARGNGAVANLLGTPDRLKELGIELDPEAVSNLSSIVDPVNFVPFGAAVKGVGKFGEFVIGRALSPEAAAGIARTLNATRKGTLALPGRAVQLAGKGVEEAGRAAPTAGIVGALTGHPAALVGLAARPVVRKGGQAIQSLGRVLASPETVGVVDDILFNPVTRRAAEGAAIGTAFSIPFALGAREEEEGQILGAGGGLGALGGGFQGLRESPRAIWNRLTTPVQHAERTSPGYGTNANLDSLNATQSGSLQPVQQNLFNAVREYMRPRGVEIYLLPEKDFVDATGTSGAQGYWHKTENGGTQIFLNNDITALMHELYHTLKRQLPAEEIAAFEKTVADSMTPEQRQQFQDTMESALGEEAAKQNLTEEVSAEAASQILQGMNFDNISPTVYQRGLMLAGRFLELLGFNEAGYRPEDAGQPGVSPLGIAPSFKAARQFRAIEEAPIQPKKPVSPTGEKAPIDETPLQPQKPKTKAQERIDVELRNEPAKVAVSLEAADPKWDEAAALLANATDQEKKAFQILRDAANAGQGAVGPLALKYFSVIEEGTKPVRRADRRLQQEVAYIREALGAAPEDVREIASKTFVPTRLEIRTRPDGTPNINVIGTSPDKIFANAILAAREAKRVGIDLPIDTSEGKITTAGFSQLNDALNKYTQNHMNGYGGDGTKLNRPANLEAFIPDENPNYTPQPLDPRVAEFVNLIQGIEPPRSTAKMDRTRRFGPTGKEITTPRNLEALKLVKANPPRPVLEAVNVKPGKKSTGKPWNVFEGGEKISEFNPLRDEFAKKGVDLHDILAESPEELSLEHILESKKVESPLRGVSTPLATAGFMPKAVEMIAERVDRSSSDQFRALTDSWKGGLTGKAREVGQAMREAVETGDFSALTDLQKKWEGEASRLIKERNFDDAVIAGSKAQFFREAAETATNTGSMKEREGSFMAKGKEESITPDEVIARITPEGMNALAAAHGTDGGSTYNVVTGKRLTDEPVFVVSIYPERSEVVTGKNVTAERLSAFAKKNADLLADPENSIGTWYDAEADKTYVDVSVSTEDQGLAELLGKKFNQRGIWDNQANKVIETGGTGEAVKSTTPESQRIAEGRQELVSAMREAMTPLVDALRESFGRRPAEPGTGEPGSYMAKRLPTDEEVTNALSSDKKQFVGVARDLPEGTAIGVRIDIPAYERTGTYVQTIHEGKAGGVGKRIGYDSIVTLDNPVFQSNEKGAEKIRAGSAKFPVATVEGKFNSARELPTGEGWTEVGYNPKRHSYFYEKGTDKLVESGSKAISVGNSVFVKDAVFGDESKAAYMPKPPSEQHERASLKYLAQEPPKIRPTGAEGKNWLWDLMNHLSEDNAKKGELLKHDDDNRKVLADALTDEALHAFENNRDALGWYDRKIKAALKAIEELHPELKDDPNRSALYKALVAINSNGQAVRENFFRADDLYNTWKQTGKIDFTSEWGGSNAPAINKGLENLTKLIDTLGLDGAREFMEKEFTIGELKKAGFKTPAEKVSTKVRGSMIFGAKIGAFFSNLNGDFSPVTMDRWFMRTINRLRGVLTRPDPKSTLKHLDAFIEVMDKEGEDLGHNLAEAHSDLVKMREDVAAGKSVDVLSPGARYVTDKFRRYSGDSFSDRSPVNRASKLLQEDLFPVHQHPANGGERAWLRQVIGDVQAKLKAQGVELTNADLQALLWYYEKDLYSKLGFENSRADATDYELAAQELLSERTGNPGSAGRPNGPGDIGVVEVRAKRNAGAKRSKVRGAEETGLNELPLTYTKK